jgi:hypothetical protein
MTKRPRNWLTIAIVAWSLALIMNMVRIEYQMHQLRQQISETDTGARKAVGLLVQALANVHARVRMIEARRMPEGTF